MTTPIKDALANAIKDAPEGSDPNVLTLYRVVEAYLANIPAPDTFKRTVALKRLESALVETLNALESVEDSI